MNFFTRLNQLSAIAFCAVSLVASISPAWSQGCDPLEEGEGCGEPSGSIDPASPDNGDATGTITQPAESPHFRVPAAGSFTASTPVANTVLSNWFRAAMKKPGFGLRLGSGDPDLVSLPTGNASTSAAVAATTGISINNGSSTGAGSAGASGGGVNATGNATNAGASGDASSSGGEGDSSINISNGQEKKASNSPNPSSHELVDGGPGLWVQSYGDFQRNEAGRNGSGDQLSQTGGVLAGLEWLSIDRSGNGYAFRVGGGYNYTSLNFSGSDPNSNIAGGTIVSFLGVSEGDLILSALGKIDFFNYNVDTVGGTSLTNYSLAVNAEYDLVKYVYNHAYVALGPIASVQYSYTDFADSASLFSLQNGESVRVEGGWQISTTVVDRGVIYTSLVSATAYSDVLINGYSSILSPATLDPFTNIDEGQVLGHLNFFLGADFRDGLTASLNFGLRGGEDMVGGDAAVNVAYRW